MGRPKTPQLTEAEQRIMAVLWEHGEASVRQVTEALHEAHGLAYTSVLTIMRIMSDKGYLAFRKEGRAYIYRPLLTRAGARRSALRSIVSSLFDGSAQSLAQHLVDDEQLTLDDIEELRTLLLQKEEKDGQNDC